MPASANDDAGSQAPSSARTDVSSSSIVDSLTSSNDKSKPLKSALRQTAPSSESGGPHVTNPTDSGRHATAGIADKGSATAPLKREVRFDDQPISYPAGEKDVSADDEASEFDDAADPHLSSKYRHHSMPAEERMEHALMIKKINIAEFVSRKDSAAYRVPYGEHQRAEGQANSGEGSRTLESMFGGEVLRQLQSLTFPSKAVSQPDSDAEKDDTD